MATSGSSPLVPPRLVDAACLEVPFDEPIETAPGVVVERRSFLSVAAGALLAPRVVDLEAGARNDTRWTLEEFVEEVVPIAKECKAALAAKPARSAEDAYLHTLASFAVRLGDVDPPELRPTSQGEGVEIGARWMGDPFVVLYWRIQPGASVRLHAHTYGNVCTVGLEGRVRVRNYETVGPLDWSVTEPIDVRRTNDQLLDPNGINLVPLSHGFCHGMDNGPTVARGLDITTRLAERAPTPYLELDSAPIDEAAGLYRGTWVVE